MSTYENDTTAGIHAHTWSVISHLVWFICYVFEYGALGIRIRDTIRDTLKKVIEHTIESAF